MRAGDRVAVTFYYNNPRDTKAIITLPDDWDDLSQDEQDEFMLDQAPYADVCAEEWSCRE